MAVGYQTTLIEPSGDIRKGNGTSFAAPAMAGFVACLKQAHPERSNMEIISAIRQSADRYTKPDVKGGYGYGIPDACKADEILSEMDRQFANQKAWVVKDDYKYKVKKRKIKLRKTSAKKGKIEIRDTVEKVYSSSSWPKRCLKIRKLPKGNYSFRLLDADGKVIGVENFLKK